MEPNRIILVLTVLVIVTCLCWTALAKTVTGVGVHQFGVSITENQSCEIAKQKAEADAIRNAFGETVGSTDWQMCDDNNCDYSFFSWIEQQGQITGILNETRVILNNPRQCRISIVAKVEEIKLQDPNFHLNLKINNTIFKEGEHLKIHIKPSTKMYVYVFNWANGDGFYKLYDGKISDKITLPTTDKYAYVARLLDAKESKEFILVVGSKKPLHFIDTYKTETLLEILQQHRIQGALIQKINFKIIL
ncbi:hypothetical protein CMI38_05460 [Candidatus Pacearchaeota archaeon]|jgi:hypothetical protein|nr:hypothetical protein [Candidatus Pacearchaeota archaeon]|tara:strand:+ start:2114 stop:2857 length:744 start_codon:yes stop_codon:yes gene_type:complete